MTTSRIQAWYQDPKNTQFSPNSVIRNGQDGSEIAQRQIEQGMEYSHASAELYYRLESFIQQGFVHKRRIATDGQFSHALTEEFRSQMPGFGVGL
jgi:hypothetical protein